MLMMFTVLTMALLASLSESIPANQDSHIDVKPAQETTSTPSEASDSHDLEKTGSLPDSGCEITLVDMLVKPGEGEKHETDKKLLSSMLDLLESHDSLRMKTCKECPFFPVK